MSNYKNEINRPDPGVLLTVQHVEQQLRDYMQLHQIASAIGRMLLFVTREA